jgi:hypothetical protein
MGPVNRGPMRPPCAGPLIVCAWTRTRPLRTGLSFGAVRWTADPPFTNKHRLNYSYPTARPPDRPTA